MKRGIAKATERAMQRTAKEMRRLVPVDEGTLRDSIVVRPGFRRDRAGKLAEAPDNPTAFAISAGGKTIGGDGFYAHMVEFGTAPRVNGGVFAGTEHPGTPPQPFFYTTFRANRRNIRSTINRAVRKALKDT